MGLGNSSTNEIPSIPEEPRVVPKRPPTLRIAVVGDRNEVFIQNYGPKELQQTTPLSTPSYLVYYERLSPCLRRSGDPFKLNIWGFLPFPETFSWDVSMSYCEGYIILYNIGNRKSYQRSTRLISRIRKCHPLRPLFFVGWPSSHLEREVSKEEGERFASEHEISFFELDEEPEERERICEPEEGEKEKEKEKEKENQQPTELGGGFFSEIVMQTELLKGETFGANVKRAQ